MHGSDFIGLVLCGGRSTRMGHDKGLISSGKTTWAEQQSDKLSTLGMPAFISVNGSQALAYQQIFPPHQLISDHPFSHINGPLRGLLSVHQAFPGKHVLCLPCDMPDLSETFLAEILNTFTANYPQYQLFIPKVSLQMQPLCGIYTKESLRYFIREYEAGRLTNKSMIHIVAQYPGTMMISFDDTDEGEFENYNTPEDLK